LAAFLPVLEFLRTLGLARRAAVAICVGTIITGRPGISKTD
jgi:hypothetical protein